MTTSSANNLVFWGFFEKQKLTGPNFIDWYRQLRIVLSIEDKLNYLEQPLPYAPVAPEGLQVAPEIIAAHTAWIKGSKKIAGLMLMTNQLEIQQNLENLYANDMLKELKILPGKTINELHAMLKLHEQTLALPKNNAPALYAIRAGKGKHNLAYAPKRKIPPPPKREDPAKDSIYHECGKTCHWKRNYPQYLAGLLKKKKNAASGADGSGLWASRKLKPGALSQVLKAMST
ncbi:hypothetical protein Tco_0687769 [Tanacetum coccineum]